MHDVLIAGNGPAGLALTRTLARGGADVLCVAPSFSEPWHNNYGVWVDEIELSGWGDCLERTWSSAVVHLDDRRSHLLCRAYGRIDNRALRERMLEEAAESGAQFAERSVASVDASAERTTVGFDSGVTAATRLFVDATGHDGRFVRRAPTGELAAQVAYGGTLHAPGHGWPIDQVVLMDFRDRVDVPEPGSSTFLYALPLSEDRIFVEETALVSRPPSSFEDLRERLRLRLKRLGLEGSKIEDEERCFIPMGLPLPDLSQAVFGFGGAASMVHPASGYMIANVLRSAEGVAQALLEQSDRSPCERAWGALWTPDRARAWSLYRFGMELLLELDLEETRIFFDRFFRLPPDLWQNYLSGLGSSRDVTAAMRVLFSRLPWALRIELARLALGSKRRHLLEAFL